MANLLYAEYNAGCSVFWYNDHSGPADYHYGMDASRACYYADLEPNTTYTIQRIDSSDRFRVALTSQDLKYLTATSDTVVRTPFSWGYEADNSLPITFTTGSDNIHLVALYTITSQYNTRVMLNEGSSIEPYEASTRYFKDHWHLVDGILLLDDLPEPIENNLTPPYPASLWRLDSDDILTLNSEDWSPFPEPSPNFTPPYPATMWYLDEDDALFTSLLPEALNPFTPPYPASLWYLDEELDNVLMTSMLPNEIPLGSFCGCANLTYVRIPETVTRIGDEAFRNTGITLAKLPRGCRYGKKSFPPDCEIQFYDV